VMVLKGWTRIKKSGRARVRSKKQLLVKDSGAARAWKTPRVVETSTTVAPCACKAGWNGPEPDFALRPFANTWRAMDGSIRFVKDQNPA
jgi:hypothetical protein